MSPTRPLLVSALALSVLVAAGATAQPEPRRQGPGFSAERFVDRMMEGDTDGDGKLSREEIPGRFGEDIFAQGDADKDGLISREELTKFADERFAMRGAGAARGLAGGFEGQMRRAGDAAKALRASPMTAESLETDLRDVGTLEAALVLAKNESGSVEMSAQAKEKYAEDAGAYRKGLRLELLGAIGTALDVERALIEGDADVARARLEKLFEVRDGAHELFQPDI